MTLLKRTRTIGPEDEGEGKNTPELGFRFVGDFAPPTPPPAAFSPAGDVRAAAWCPVHLFIRACGQSADQRCRAARAGVAAAQPLGIVSPTPDRLLFSL